MTMNAGKDLKLCWDRIAQRLRVELGEDLYSSWFARMEPEEWSDGRLAVSVPTRFLRNWIETHYQSRLHKLSEAELGQVDAVQVRVRTRGVPHRATDLPAAVPVTTEEPAPMRRPTIPSSLAGERGSPLDPTQTFESFFIGGSNRLAHAAALRVAEAAQGMPVSFNPLFVHSAAGLGKTHLLNAIAWRIRNAQADRRVLYITAERFMYHFIGALKQRDTIAFKDYFQSIDVLLIDDFQFLQGKTMQQEFCHTFNSLVDSKRQVVIAADVPPAQLDTIDQRMRSRLLGGLVVDIELPDLELRREILANRLESARREFPGLQMSPDVLEFIANTCTGGGRELEGALNKMIAHYQLSHAPVTLDLAAMVLRDMAQNPDQCRVKIEDILKVIGRHYNVPRADLLSARRSRAVVVPRQIGMYLAKKLTPRSLPEIGRRFGGRDHSTVLHAVRKIEDQMRTDDRLAREVALLIRLIEQQ
ncbi:MAG: chromosomal replication initiator protein DnaA [Rhizobiales bacterium]|nr:chromosomal replication initiator protein DnaA [Hyphomicrobiales bacterium]